MTAHLIGVVLWVGGLFGDRTGCSGSTRTRPKTSHEKLTLMERSLALTMDIAATLAIGCGYARSGTAVRIRRRICSRRPARLAPHQAHGRRARHPAVHGMVRGADRKFSRGDLKPVPTVGVVAAARVDRARSRSRGRDEARTRSRRSACGRSCTSISTRSTRRSNSGMIRALRGKPVLVGGSVAARRRRVVLVRGAHVRHQERDADGRGDAALPARDRRAPPDGSLRRGVAALLRDPRRLLARGRRPVARRGVPRLSPAASACSATAATIAHAIKQRVTRRARRSSPRSASRRSSSRRRSRRTSTSPMACASSRRGPARRSCIRCR